LRGAHIERHAFLLALLRALLDALVVEVDFGSVEENREIVDARPHWPCTTMRSMDPSRVA
jgi:hypothetical protein